MAIRCSSGVVNAGGPFNLRATATAEHSTYAAVVRLVHAAERERPPLVRLADRWALGFLLVTHRARRRRLVGGGRCPHGHWRCWSLRRRVR